MWREHLTPALRGRRYRALARELEPRVRRFGYSLEDPTARGDRPGLIAAAGGT